jgi:hypothetical protein
MKFPAYYRRIPASEADKYVKTYKRVEENGEVKFVEVDAKDR